MQPITVSEIVTATGGIWWNPKEQEIQISDVSTDSRNIMDNCLFVPLTGDHFDGHSFIPQALEAGAAGCLCTKLPQEIRPDKFYIKVADTRLALKALAGDYRARFAIPVVQITGSVGKTTTKEMVSSVLGTRLNVLKTPENYNNDIGTPLTLFRLAPTHQTAVIETGMNHFGEIAYLGEIVRPNIAIITNIGDAHIEFLGSREGILKAKCEIFANLKEDGVVILNGDDALLNTVNVPFRTVRCGKSEHCQVRVSDVVDRGVAGITCTVTTEKDTYSLKIPSPGEYMVYAASIAVAAAEELGLRREEIVRGVAAYEPTGSRMRVIHLPENRILLDDCYNANPQSVTAALEVLAHTDSERRVAVLGDMGELGELTEQAHYNMGALAAMLGVDFVVAIGSKAGRIADGTFMGGGEVLHFTTREAAEETLKEQLKPGTAMLLKASHAMHFERLVKALEESYD